MENKFRVLFLDTRPIRRGAQVFVHELKQKFSADGIPVRRIFLYEENKYEQLVLDENDLVMPFREDHFFEKIPTVHPSLVVRLANEIKSFSPDIILCNGSRTLKYAAVVKKCYPGIKSKWVYRVIDSAVYWNRRSITQLYYRYFVIPAMDGAVGVSQKSLSEMIHHYGFKKPSVCIPRAINVEYFSKFIPEDNSREKAGIKPDSFVLLFLGNFTKQKRPDRFLDIIYELQKQIPNVHGLMVGDGPLKVEVEEQAQQLGIQARITYTGYQSDVRPWIAMSDILLLTSDTEGMPGVVLEAAAMKTPSISGNVGGVAEFIENGINGLIIEWMDDLKPIASIIKIYDNSNQIKFFGENAYKKVQIYFLIDRIIERYKLFVFKLCQITS
jgi:glycosyltransferase involved in cell wall biosynthesis